MKFIQDQENDSTRRKTEFDMKLLRHTVLPNQRTDRLKAYPLLNLTQCLAIVS